VSVLVGNQPTFDSTLFFVAFSARIFQGKRARVFFFGLNKAALQGGVVGLGIPTLQTRFVDIG
jgi:hypothetical protein